MSTTRWKRYGKDRLYVKTADGDTVGYLDLLTGETELLAPEWQAQFEEALRTHATTDAVAGELTGEAPSAEESAVAGTDGDPAAPSGEPYAVEVRWTDLARNAPGQAVRQQAIAARKAAPVRTVVARVLGVHTDERAWRIGAAGEELVASQLARLPRGWHCLHAIPIGDRGTDIDHLVIGPGGVFVINTKHHPDKKIVVRGDTFRVNGYRTRYVHASRGEAARAGRLLSRVTATPVSVTGVIVVVGAREGFQVHAQPRDVQVVGRKHLAAWLTARPVTLDEQQAGEIFRVARRSDTWQPVNA